MEFECEVKSIEIDMLCNKCRKGFMRYNKEIGILTSNPVQYPHSCRMC